jgi:hypothetical protein
MSFRKFRHSLLSSVRRNNMDLIDRASVLKAIDEYERLSAVSQTVRNMTSLREIVQWLPAVQPQPEEDCDTCKHGYFGDRG